MSPARRRRLPRLWVMLVGMVAGVTAVVLFAVSTFFIAQYRAGMIQSARTASAQACNQVAVTVARYVRDMNEVMDLVQTSMEYEGADRDEFLRDLLRVRSDVVAVTTYTENGDLVDCWSLDHEPRDQILQNLSFDAESAASADSYVTPPHVETIFESYYPWVVTMANRLPGKETAAWVSLDLSFSTISEYISNVGIGAHGYCFLMDRDGNVVYHPQQQLIYSGLKSEDTAHLAELPDGVWTEKTVIYSITGIEDSTWRVVGVSYVDELVDLSVKAMLRICLGVAATVLAAALGTGWVLSRILSRPLAALASAMERFEQDADHFAYEPVSGTREVEELSDSFGHMVHRIQHLMATVREEEVNLRKTELKALQAQINPHFLYNTLDSIAWMCEQGRNADAVNMVHALARLFRISISKGHELIPIRKELEHAESYLQIQKYRYKNQFTYDFKVDESCLDCLCNKITLQPILENAIAHGLDLMVEPGHIDVEVCRDGKDILFRVQDDGVGMDEEQVRHILHSEPGDRTGIGIKNVNDRLRIYFGEGYGLRIESEPDEGTCVEIRMPQVREGEYETK
ncbi:sensor histidine kinase [Gemmiger formicilis]|uniref:sensor histidine kinase n=1 Tax=Gemmiger formicilis TaxID=745368 RepID=UPI00195CE755|nr:sensor histidine kinase [Gemmiger formicilis]MBM6715228.1 sensor histidine kinase [Gemmiger formicilis]